MFRIARAILPDMSAIVEINRNVYFGQDYISGVYKLWLDEESSGNGRRNFVFLDGMSHGAF